MGKIHPYNGKSISTNFPGSPDTVGFVAFSRTMRNWWENPCISLIMRYTIGWESDWKIAPILWEKYEYQFPRLSPYHGFCCIFPYCGKLMGKPMHFPYDEVYLWMGIGWENSTHIMGKVWASISQTSPIPRVLLHFPVLWEIYGETHAFPIWRHWLIFFLCPIRAGMSFIVISSSLPSLKSNKSESEPGSHTNWTASSVLKSLFSSIILLISLWINKKA